MTYYLIYISKNNEDCVKKTPDKLILSIIEDFESFYPKN